MNKRELLIATISAFFGALISTFVFLWLAKLGRDIGSLADWFSAIGTTAAVVVALLPQMRKEKPNVVFSARSVDGKLNWQPTYANISGAAGYFKQKKARWHEVNGEWKEYNPDAFDLGFLVAAYQKDEFFKSRLMYACPNFYEDIPIENDYGEQVGTDTVEWDLAEITFFDEINNVSAILKLKNTDGVITIKD